ncbi:MAG: hypothetical protein HN377_05790 [Alphaproteobacteria bacterium]|jgi:hypothetical protein|nr:hypothetical protein [Alphaproteobacteria bacterium]
MYARIVTIGISVLLGACSYVSEYEKAVYDLEPTYCYKSIGKVACYKEPFHRDEKRLVNYFGPHPSRYDKPDVPEATPIAAPEMVNYWVKDPEPIPRPAPTGKVSNLPWLDPAVAKTQSENREFLRLSANPAGTQVLLGKMGIGPNGQVDLKAARQVSQPVPQTASQPVS